MKKRLTFAEVEELACLTYNAYLEFDYTKEQASKAAQAIWDQHTYV